MQTKILISMILFISILLFSYQRREANRLKENLKEKDTLLILIQRNTEINIADLQNRNNELINRNEELQLLFNETEEISSNVKQTNKNDCLNQSVNLDIVKLLQKAGI